MSPREPLLSLAVAPLCLSLALQGKETGAPPEGTPQGGFELSFAPSELLYPDYVADLRRPTFGFALRSVGDAEIPEAGDTRYVVRMGARFGLLRMERDGGSPLWQVDGHMGFYAEFDRENSTDNLGWDGIYGLDVTVPAGERLVLQLGMAHDSAHLGDEYIEQTGTPRIDYTRQEVNLGARLRLVRAWSAYAEYGHGFDLRNEELQEPGRAQGGLEGEFGLPLEHFCGYAALNLDAYEEDAWDVSSSLQLGVRPLSAPGGAVWRFGLELYDGRSPLAELFQHEEAWIGVCFTVDP
jgi:hypothetical protein